MISARDLCKCLPPAYNHSIIYSKHSLSQCNFASQIKLSVKHVINATYAQAIWALSSVKFYLQKETI